MTGPAQPTVPTTPGTVNGPHGQALVDQTGPLGGHILGAIDEAVAAAAQRTVVVNVPAPVVNVTVPPQPAAVVHVTCSHSCDGSHSHHTDIHVHDHWYDSWIGLFWIFLVGVAVFLLTWLVIVLCADVSIERSAIIGGIAGTVVFLAGASFAGSIRERA